MRGNQLAGAAPAPRFPPPRLLPFHLTFFFFLPPNNNKVIYLFQRKPHAPSHLLWSRRGEQRRETPLSVTPHGCRWQEEPPPRTEGQLWLIDFWCQELGPEAVRQHINCDPIIS